VITLSIVANITVLCLGKYPEDPDLINLTDKLNLAFTGLFTIELLIKLIGTGFKIFLYEKQNIFDAFIIIVSLIEIIVSSLLTRTGWLDKVRLLRVLRVLRLAEQWSRLR
jgi:hypothetical protein